MVEPSSEAGGDAFDYALAEHSVSLAVFDAMGHGLAAALMASTALAALRSARRSGRTSPRSTSPNRARPNWPAS